MNIQQRRRFSFCNSYSLHRTIVRLLHIYTFYLTYIRREVLICQIGKLLSFSQFCCCKYICFEIKIIYLWRIAETFLTQSNIYIYSDSIAMSIFSVSLTFGNFTIIFKRNVCKNKFTEFLNVKSCIRLCIYLLI